MANCSCVLGATEIAIATARGAARNDCLRIVVVCWFEEDGRQLGGAVLRVEEHVARGCVLLMRCSCRWRLLELIIVMVLVGSGLLGDGRWRLLEHEMGTLERDCFAFVTLNWCSVLIRSYHCLSFIIVFKFLVECRLLFDIIDAFLFNRL